MYEDLLSQLASCVGKPLADKDSKQTQAVRDAYQLIKQGAEPRPILTELRRKLKGKTYKDERAVLKTLCENVRCPPLRLKWPYPLVPWTTDGTTQNKPKVP